MADPASIIGVITGLVELADMVFVRTFLYVKALKEKDEKISALNSEVGALFGILSRLRLLYNVMEAEGDRRGCQPGLETQLLNNCLKTLFTIKTRLDAQNDQSKHHRLCPTLKSLQWPFTSSEVEELLREIERHKANLSVALAADALSELLRALSTQDKISETVHGIERELTRITLNRQRRRMLASFWSEDCGEHHDMSRKLWRPSTGLWFTNGIDFHGWLTDKTTKNLWCYGIPGSGKTVLASAVIKKS